MSTRFSVSGVGTLQGTRATPMKKLSLSRSVAARTVRRDPPRAMIPLWATTPPPCADVTVAARSRTRGTCGVTDVRSRDQNVVHEEVEGVNRVVRDQVNGSGVHVHQAGGTKLGRSTDRVTLLGQ